MEAKEYLRTYNEQVIKIKRINSSIQQLKDAATSITASCEGERVQTSSSQDKIGNLVAMICDKKEEKMKMIKEALDTMSDIEEVINQVKDERQRAVLHLHYIGLLKWEDVAVTMSYQLSTIFTFHGKALQQVNEILKQKECSKK